MLLHGVGGNEENLAPLASLLPEDTLVILARGPRQIGPAQFAWFEVAFTENGPRINATQAEESRRRLIEFLDHIQTSHHLTPAQTVIGGFSQGGIMSASVGLTSPESAAGFALLSGRILPEIQTQLASRERLAHLQAFIAHGQLDTTLPPQWADKSDTLLKTLGLAHHSHRYPVGHRISSEMAGDFSAWIKEVFERKDV